MEAQENDQRTISTYFKQQEHYYSYLKQKINKIFLSILFCLLFTVPAIASTQAPIKIVFIAYENPDQLVDDVKPVRQIRQNRTPRIKNI